MLFIFRHDGGGTEVNDVSIYMLTLLHVSAMKDNSFRDASPSNRVLGPLKGDFVLTTSFVCPHSGAIFWMFQYYRGEMLVSPLNQHANKLDPFS